MVRLKTDRWYTSRGQDKARRTVQTQSLGTRRVISMCFLLALVVVLMQKAADPRYVSSAFRQLGVPLEDELKQDKLTPPILASGTERPAAADDPAGQRTESHAEPVNSGSSVSGEMIWKSTRDDLLNRVLASATDSQRKELCKVLFQTESGALVAEQASLDELEASAQLLFDEVRSQLSGTGLAEREGNSQAVVWSSAVDRFETQWFEFLQTQSSDNLERSLWQSLELWGYEFLVSKFVDATVWKKAERFSFETLLQQIPKDQASRRGGVPEVATRQLLAESEMLRGNVIEFRGKLRRLDLHRFNETGGDADGVGQYSVLWLRGDDEAYRPVAVYAAKAAVDADLQSDLARVPSQALIEADDAIGVAVQGVFVKQLAYSSASGLQIAPVLLAARVQRDVVEVPSQAMGQGRESAIWKDIGFAFLVALLICGVILALIVPGFQKTKRVPSLRSARTRLPNNGGGRGGMSVLLPWVTTLMLTQSVFAQRPPWASTGDAKSVAEAAAVQYMSARLDAVMTSDAKQQINDYSTIPDISARPVPDAILKIQQGLEKAGAKRLLNGLQKTAANSGDGRSAILIEGDLVDIQQVNISREQRNWFGNDSKAAVYRLIVRGASPRERSADSDSEGESAQTAPSGVFVVYVARVPKLLIRSEKVRQPIRIGAMQLFGCKAVFAEGVSWSIPGDLPQAEFEALSPRLPEHYVKIGQAGWDLAFLDLVSRNRDRPLSSDESESFFRFMDAARKLWYDDDKPNALGDNEPDGKVSGSALQPSESPAIVLKEAAVNCGRPVRWIVRASVGTMISTPPEVLAVQPNLPPRYFQIDGFVHLGNKRISLKVPTENGDEELLFEREYPITVVTYDQSAVPENVLEGRAVNWEIDRYLEVQGAFYRMWSYQSELVDSKNSKARQIAPLVAAATLEPTRLPISSSGASPIAWFGVAMCVAVLCILGGILYLALKRDIGFKRR